MVHFGDHTSKHPVGFTVSSLASEHVHRLLARFGYAHVRSRYDHRLLGRCGFQSRRRWRGEEEVSPKMEEKEADMRALRPINHRTKTSRT